MIENMVGKKENERKKKVHCETFLLACVVVHFIIYLIFIWFGFLFRTQKRSIFNRLIIGQKTYLAFIHYSGFCWLCFWLLDFWLLLFSSPFRFNLLFGFRCAASIGQHHHHHHRRHNTDSLVRVGKLKSWFFSLFLHFDAFTDVYEIIIQWKYVRKIWRWDCKRGGMKSREC